MFQPRSAERAAEEVPTEFPAGALEVLAAPLAFRLVFDTRFASIKDRIEFFNFAIEFFDQFRNFHQNFSEFSKFSAILTEFGYFGARSRKSDKISSQFRREIAVFLRKL